MGTSLFKGISVTTSAGSMAFGGIDNSDQIHSVISELLIQRQKENSVVSKLEAETKAVSSDVIDELKKYKELLDSDVITKDEFELKKKQLMGL